MNNQYGEMPKGKDGVNGLSNYERQATNRQYQRREAEYHKTAVKSMEKSVGSSEALRKYQLAKRDYDKASFLGKAYLKLTGQANFKKMLEEANKGMSR